MMQITQLFKDIRTVWAGVLSLVALAAWAGDQRWMPKEDSAKIISIMQIRQLSQRNDELEIEKTYESDDQRKKMLDAIIKINKNKIETIINETQISEGDM